MTSHGYTNTGDQTVQISCRSGVLWFSCLKNRKEESMMGRETFLLIDLLKWQTLIWGPYSSLIKLAPQSKTETLFDSFTECVWL